ncbi:MAG: DM13 domain-containing protein [Actinomycetia bacterium]|nr:DM13 domain-containing protein [Actinomycetes bacterium]
MKFLMRWKWPILGIGTIVVIVGFLAFRPDKLFVDDVVDESLSDAFVTDSSAAPPATTTTAAPTSDSTAPSESSTTTAPAPTTTQPSVPLAISTGAFFGIDHAASGTATVYEQDGAYVLRFEDDTDIQNGPDLYIWLLEDDEYSGGEPSEYIDLGKIKGNVGGQNYELPAEFDPDVHKSVLVWCLRFSVPFAAAPLA